MAQDLLAIACKNETMSNFLFTKSNSWQSKLRIAPSTLESASDFDLQMSRNTSEWIEKFKAVQDCPDCNGTRLKKSTLAVTIDNKNIDFLTKETIGDLLDFFNNLKLTNIKFQISEQTLIFKE